MNRGKKIFFVALMIFLVGIPLLNRVMDNVAGNKSLEVSTESYELEAGLYVAGEDFEPGIYDIVSTSDTMKCSGETLYEGEKISGMYLAESYSILIEGEGTVQLVPADKTPLEVNMNGELIFTNSGNYDVGTQIAPGTYEISYNVEGDIELAYYETPVVWVDTGYGVESETIYTYDQGDENEIELEDGQVLCISMRGIPPEGEIARNINVDVVLTKVD